MATSYNGGIPLDTDTEAVRTYPASGAEFVDTANGVAVFEQGQFNYEAVAASQTNQVLGVTGGLGDFLHRLLVSITTSTGTLVQIKDGADTAITVLPTGLTAPGYYNIELNIASKTGAWQITTGANVSVLAVGRFTA